MPVRSVAVLAIGWGTVVSCLLLTSGCSSSKDEPQASTEQPAESGTSAAIELIADVPYDDKPELVALDGAVKQIGGSIRVYKNAPPDAASSGAPPAPAADAPLQVAINLHGASVTDAQVAQLAQLPGFAQATVINVSQTDISDESLVQIAKAEQMEFLSLSGTKVTDRGLDHLMGHKRLALVYFDSYSDGRGISQQAAQRLQGSLPNAPPAAP